MLRLKQHRRATPIYRESGYARRLAPVSRIELYLWLAALVAALLAGALILLARGYSQWVESYYSMGFYPAWAGVVSLFTGWLPFSLAQWLLVAFVLLCVALVVHTVVHMVRYPRQRGGVLLRFGTRALAVAAAVLLLFTMGGGLNYYRYSFASYSGLELRPATVQELTGLCTQLAQNANTLRAQQQEDPGGISRYTQQSAWELGKAANAGYTALLQNSPQWQPLLELATTVRPKPVLFSQAMSYMQIVGVFFPFTIEANVNVDIVDYNLPNAMCHELAHVAGFMREDEANFLAYLACTAGEDSFVSYSGVMLALVHSTNALYGSDPAAYSTVMQSLDAGVLRDLAASSAYFEKYDTPFGDFSTAVNDAYLRANQQADGVQSYGRMVDLLLADYRSKQ